MTAYNAFREDTQPFPPDVDIPSDEPILLTDYGTIMSSEDDACDLLNTGPRPRFAATPQQIRLGICSNWDDQIYNSKTALEFLFEYGGLSNHETFVEIVCAGLSDPDEIMRIVSAGIRSLSKGEAI